MLTMSETVDMLNEMIAKMANKFSIAFSLYLFRLGVEMLRLPDMSDDLGFDPHTTIHRMLTLCLAFTTLLLGSSLIAIVQAFCAKVSQPLRVLQLAE
jgi:hypothetical protein